MTIGNTRTSPVLTPDGGIAIRMINKTGAASVKGSVLGAEGTTDRAVKLAAIDSPDPMGIMYSSNVPDGGEVLVVVSGIAKVLYSTSVTRATFARVPETADGSATAGQAIAEALPVPPFATNKHFQEIGHPIESIGSPGLALTALHFN
jgi:hypothetical protein